MKVLRILVVDDHPLAREGVKTMLSRFKSLSVVGTASNGGEALKLARQLSPDVVLMDVLLPDTHGAETTEALLGANPGLVVIGLTISEEDEDVRRMLAAGARGYLLKDADPKQLRAAITSAARGGTPISPTVATPTKQKGGGVPEAPPTLTGRQKALLHMLAKGYANKMIARALGVSPATVKVYLYALYEKLGVQNRAEAAARAVALGLIED